MQFANGFRGIRLDYFRVPAYERVFKHNNNSDLVFSYKAHTSKEKPDFYDVFLLSYKRNRGEKVLKDFCRIYKERGKWVIYDVNDQEVEAYDDLEKAITMVRIYAKF